MKKLIITKENPNGVLSDLTSDEVTQIENDKIKDAEETTALQADKEAKDNLKASAKAKLIAGEALTEDEADTIVI